MGDQKEKLKHLEWAIQSRSRNQMCSLRLLALFHEYEASWKTKKWSRAAQDLLAVAFSLWRAAFLADKTSKRADVFSHAKSFLEKMVEDNAIAYLQDKNSREWTFNYYTRNARYFLQTLAQFWPQQVPAYQGKKRDPMERWTYCQDLLDQAVDNFGKLLMERHKAGELAKKSRVTRTKKRQRRQIVRKLTLQQR